MLFAASCQHRAPLSVAGYGRAVSQLLAGTPNGPGGSPDAARVLGLRSQTRGRRTLSRHNERLAMTPSADEVR